MIQLRSFTILFLIIIALTGLSGRASAQGEPPSNCIYVEQDGGFESGGTWEFANTASPGFLDPAAAHGGARAAFVGIPADADNQNVDSTVWQAMQLPAAGRITATLWLRSLAGDDDDKRYIVVRDLLTDESTVLLYERPPQEDWREVSVDLTPFSGKDILLVVGVHNDGGGLKAGLWVDDVHVIACDLSATTPSGGNATATDRSAATVTPTATASAAPTAAAVSVIVPTMTPTPAPIRTAASVPAATASPTSTPTATPDPVINPRRQARRSLPDNNALPLLAGVFFSGLVAMIVIIINLRR